ncbi:G-type lectin S-receptor-like serine/threonine-protein kinase LECRK1 [Quercus robur]|uniref:G-type lectin S-receptor-like serine/threonine-protein kinase LECRK1 n=1 Tax=Quercus robur TaxID=38942 RepID=UPI002161A8CF|nr:G-type lectin S-receptor-like serine/threonine-protein kinase LECRK1 [Quercus robur]
MGSISVLFLLSMFLLAFDVKAQLQRNHSGNVIPLGSWLSPIANRTSWLSPSGLFAFGFYPQGGGFVIGIWLHTQPNNTIVWTAYPDNLTVSSNAILNFTSDGKLLLRTEQGEENSMTGFLEVIPEEPAVSASMHNSGNFVLYDNSSRVIWQSFDNPTDTILGVNGTMETFDSENAYWSLDTFYGSSVILRLNQRGLLRLTKESSTLIILVNNSYPGMKETSIIYRAILDSDGIFKLYSHHFDFGGNSNTSSKVSLEWSSLRDQCEVKGFCGFNSYCIGIGSKAECQCYSGFHFMNPKNKLLGCYSNFNEDGCSKGPMIPYDIIALRNISWGDFPYSVLLTKQENCYKSCLGDCNCNAAFYMNGTCNKYKLPLKYGRSHNLSSIAFFKVIRRNDKISDHQPPIPEILMDSKKMMILILSLTLGSIALMCSVIAISCFFMYRHQVHRYRKLSPENVNVEIAENFTLRSFSYNELENATDGFKEALSKGSFGSVYKGYVSEANKTIAVKRLEKFVEEGEREFRAEMTVIGRTHHRNIVQLLGFCIEGSRKLLVYEYMCNGSLEDLLFKATKRPLWKERVRIALEVARGVFYLHQECEVHIIHCNLKPRNILMDDTWTAKISDFGLARLSVPNQMRIVMGIEGTSEYSAPEWQKNALISVKADIYSFGVLLLEIVCCRRSIEVNVLAADEILISDWIYNCLVAGQLDNLLEDENVDVKTLERMVKVGLWCIQDDPALRPPMKNVILMLEGTMSIAIPPSPAISHS